MFYNNNRDSLFFVNRRNEIELFAYAPGRQILKRSSNNILLRFFYDGSGSSHFLGRFVTSRWPLRPIRIALHGAVQVTYQPYTHPLVCDVFTASENNIKEEEEIKFKKKRKRWTRFCESRRSVSFTRETGESICFLRRVQRT